MKKILVMIGAIAALSLSATSFASQQNNFSTQSKSSVYLSAEFGYGSSNQKADLGTDINDNAIIKTGNQRDLMYGATIGVQAGKYFATELEYSKLPSINQTVKDNFNQIQINRDYTLMSLNTKTLIPFTRKLSGYLELGFGQVNITDILTTGNNSFLAGAVTYGLGVNYQSTQHIVLGFNLRKVALFANDYNYIGGMFNVAYHFPIN